MRRFALAAAAPAVVIAALLAVILTTGGSRPHHPRPIAPAHVVVCPRAAAGHGSMGICAPPAGPGFKAPAPLAAGAITYPDLSNNNPAKDLAPIARAHPAVYLKANQGTGFTDRMFLPMAQSARTHRMAVGGYDFVADYNATEARRFVTLLHQAGLTSRSAMTMPPTLDVEYGHATRSGVQAMVDVLHAAFGRVNIYTGGWYWTPHLGCWWPKGVTGWLAGYPSAPRLCGMPAGAYTQHQYTDRGFNGLFASDMNLWLGSRAGWRAFINTPTPKPKPKPRPVANTLPGHYPNYPRLGKTEKRHAGALLAARRWTNAHHGFDRAHRSAAGCARAALMRTVRALAHSDRRRYHRAARLSCMRSILHARWKRGF